MTTRPMTDSALRLWQVLQANVKGESLADVRARIEEIVRNPDAVVSGDSVEKAIAEQGKRSGRWVPVLFEWPPTFKWVEDGHDGS